MPDYDSKSIPVLNDVIDDDDITAENETVDLTNIKASADDDNFDLFVDDLTESIDDTEVIPLENLRVETTDSENITHDIGNIDDIADQDNLLATGATAFGAAALKDEAPTASISDKMNTAIANNEKIYLEEDNILSVDLPADEPEIESALIDYGIKEASPLAEPVEAVPVEIEAPLVATLDEPEVETITHHTDSPATPAITLESLTEDIMKQIMPGLEEQLHHLVQQALAEKLPEALLTSSSTGDGQNKDHEQ